MHANTQIPKVIGFERIASINGDSSWTAAAQFFWDEVVAKRSVCIGGNSAYEHFHPENDFSRMMQGTQGPETCNTYNMLRLSKMLYQHDIDENYVAYYERALYNHILSSQNPQTGGLVYFTQMRPGHYRVYSQPQTSFWCCVGSGIENHAKYGEMIYAQAGDQLYVNLFIPSKLNWQEQQTEIIQENNFPEEAATHLTINPQTEKAFTLNIRHPKWVKEGALKIKVNGEAFEDFTETSGYIAIRRTWKQGDQLDIELPMQLSTEQLADGSNYYAFLYGPIVLAARMGTEGVVGLFADDSRGGHIAQGDIIPLLDIPIIVTEPDEILSKIEPIAGKKLRFQLNGLYTDDYTDGLELMPFYSLHESRYIIYFPQANEQELEAMQAQLAEQEAAARILDSITEDVVLCGQQQPESDHFIDQKDTWTGYMYENHWREGAGWFSYKMRNEKANAKFLYVKYLDVDKARACAILVNDQSLGELKLNDESEENIKTMVVSIPEALQKEKTLEVKVQAIDKLWMTKIAEIRLLNQVPE